jgi:hypothetical protein
MERLRKYDHIPMRQGQQLLNVDRDEGHRQPEPMAV